jgi:hypothetical protein
MRASDNRAQDMGSRIHAYSYFIYVVSTLRVLRRPLPHDTTGLAPSEHTAQCSSAVVPWHPVQACTSAHPLPPLRPHPAQPHSSSQHPHPVTPAVARVAGGGEGHGGGAVGQAPRHPRRQRRCRGGPPGQLHFPRRRCQASQDLPGWVPREANHSNRHRRVSRDQERLREAIRAG